MAISNPTTLLVSGSSTDASSYTTASIAPSANAVLLLFVSNGAATTAATPTSLTGTLGLTWTQFQTQFTITSNQMKGTWYWAATNSSPPTGTIIINFGATQSSAQWHVTQILGADRTNPVVQSNSFQTASTDNPGITLAALQSGSITLGAYVSNITTAHAPGTGYTTISDSPSSTTPTIISSIEYKNPGATLVDWTLTSNVNKVIFAVEIRVGTSNTAPVVSAGADVTGAEPGTLVTLDASATDSDGTVTSLIWTQTGGTPTGVISNSGVDPCTFEVPAKATDETYVLTATATDNLGATGTDSINIGGLAATEYAAIGGVLVPILPRADV